MSNRSITLTRIKPNTYTSRRFGILGVMELDSDTTIYTNEWPWCPSEAFPEGMPGASCIKDGTYDISIEYSPILNMRIPFIHNSSLKVDLNGASSNKHRAGHAFVPHSSDYNITNNYGRFISVGLKPGLSTMSLDMITSGQEGFLLLNTFIQANNISKLEIKWG